MKLLVTFKVIPDLDQMLAGDYSADETMMVNTSFVRTMLNCFDESGLEFGLRLSDEAESLGLFVEKTALTVSGKQAELYLKTLTALKYEHTVHVDDEEWDLRFEPGQIAEIIYQYLRDFPQDYIIMGNQAVPGNNSLTPRILSGKMRIPLLENVIDLHLNQDGIIEATTEEENGIYIQKVEAPAIFSIGNAVISKLRVPTLKERLASKGKESRHIKIKNRITEKKQLISLTYVDRNRTGKILEGENVLLQFIKEYQEIKGKESL
nr:hypothetical protein [uncultured Merdimonas sp.]